MEIFPSKKKKIKESMSKITIEIFLKKKREEKKVSNINNIEKI